MIRLTLSRSCGPRELIAGEDAFFGLGVLATNFEASTKHQALLAEYRKLWRIA